MPVRTAKGGKADWAPDNNGAPGTWINIPDVRTWRLRPATDAKMYASSSTSGARKRLEGVDDFTVDIDLYVNDTTRFDTSIGITNGATGWLRLWEDATSNYVAPVYVDEYSVDVPIEAGDPISGTIRASANGTLQLPG